MPISVLYQPIINGGWRRFDVGVTTRPSDWDSAPFCVHIPIVERIRQSFDRQGLMRTLGASLESIESGTVTVACSFDERLTQQHGLLHGGVLASLVDVACGYAAGYPRHAPSGTPVLVGGSRTRTAGRVSMDMITVDLSHVPDARVGTPVTLWGEGMPIDEVATAAGTVGYELMCGVMPRVRMTMRE